MSTELVPVSDQDVATRRGVEELARLAESVDTPEDAQEIWVKGKIASDYLARVKAPYEDAWLAGKASVIAARKLGKLLIDIPSASIRAGSSPRGFGKSQRTMLTEELGISYAASNRLVRLGSADDAQFQRYIQSRESIPSVNGALVACSMRKIFTQQDTGNWSAQRRRKAGVKTPTNPSLDEAYSLIVRALGHLSGIPRGGKSVAAVSRAMDALYGAEDALKPYRGGYVK